MDEIRQSTKRRANSTHLPKFPIPAHLTKTPLAATCQAFENAFSIPQTNNAASTSLVLPLPPLGSPPKHFRPEFSNPPAKSKIFPIFHSTARPLFSPSAHPYPFFARSRLLPLQARAAAPTPSQFKICTLIPTIPINPPPPCSPP